MHSRLNVLSHRHCIIETHYTLECRHSWEERRAEAKVKEGEKSGEWAVCLAALVMWSFSPQHKQTLSCLNTRWRLKMRFLPPNSQQDPQHALSVVSRGAQQPRQFESCDRHGNFRCTCLDLKTTQRMRMKEGCCTEKGVKRARETKEGTQRGALAPVKKHCCLLDLFELWWLVLCNAVLLVELIMIISSNPFMKVC